MVVPMWQGFSVPGVVNHELHDHCFSVLAEKLDWKGSEQEFIDHLKNLERLQDEKKNIKQCYPGYQEDP